MHRNDVPNALTCIITLGASRPWPPAFSSQQARLFAEETEGRSGQHAYLSGWTGHTHGGVTEPAQAWRCRRSSQPSTTAMPGGGAVSPPPLSRPPILLPADPHRAPNRLLCSALRVSMIMRARVCGCAGVCVLTPSPSRACRPDHPFQQGLRSAHPQEPAGGARHHRQGKETLPTACCLPQ